MNYFRFAPGTSPRSPSELHEANTQTGNFEVVLGHKSAAAWSRVTRECIAQELSADQHIELGCKSAEGDLGVGNLVNGNQWSEHAAGARSRWGNRVVERAAIAELESFGFVRKVGATESQRSHVEPIINLAYYK